MASSLCLLVAAASHAGLEGRDPGGRKRDSLGEGSFLRPCNRVPERPWPSARSHLLGQLRPYPLRCLVLVDGC